MVKASGDRGWCANDTQRGTVIFQHAVAPLRWYIHILEVDNRIAESNKDSTPVPFTLDTCQRCRPKRFFDWLIEGDRSEGLAS